MKPKVKLSLCLTNSALRHEDVWRSGSIDPRILDLGTSLRWVISFTPRPFYPKGKIPRYPSNRRLGWPQNRSGRRGDMENLTPTGTRTPTLRPVTIMTALSRMDHVTQSELKSKQAAVMTEPSLSRAELNTLLWKNIASQAQVIGDGNCECRQLTLPASIYSYV
jgi:hypothetical protein